MKIIKRLFWKKDTEKSEAATDINTKDEMGYTPLATAAIEGNKEKVELLLQRGANVNLKSKGGYTPLICACVIPHIDVVRTLLDNDADVNIREDRGLTALDFAEERGFEVLSQMLRGAGAEKSGAVSPCCFTCAELSILPGGDRYWCVLRGNEVERSHMCGLYEPRERNDD